MDRILTFYKIDDDDLKEAVNAVDKRNYVYGNIYIDEDGIRWHIDDDESHFEVINGTLIAYHGGSKAIKLPNNVDQIAWKDKKFICMFKYIDLNNLQYFNTQRTECFYANNFSFKTRNGILFSGDGLELIKFPGDKIIDKYIMPDGIEIIGKGAFNNSELKEIVISESVKSLRNGAFVYSCYLERITIPKNVSHIGLYVFDNCIALREISVEAENRSFISADGVLFTRNMKEIIAYPCNKAEESYIVPESVMYIRFNAFNYPVNLKMLDISLCSRFPFHSSENFNGCSGLTIKASKAHSAELDILLKSNPELKIIYGGL